MNKNRIVLVLAALLFVTFSCKDENLAPVLTFDDAGKGAYPRRLSETDKLINLFDIAGSAYTYTIEFVDADKGNNVAEYVLDMTFVDNDPSNGDNGVGPIEFRKYTKDQFTVNANGYVAPPTVTITGTECLAAAGVSADQVSAGDNFVFTGRIVTNDGAIFAQTNSSSTIVGSAFLGHFNFTMPASCPSDLAGTYNYTTTDAWCNGGSKSGTVDIIAKGGGVYYWSDPSFGAYDICYGGPASDPGLTFNDVCLEVAFLGVTDQYGDTWTYDTSIDGESWIINWVNTYGEAANTVVTFPGGVPFTLK